MSEQAAFIITDILAGNTISSVNPYWADWAVYDGSERRPAAYKTGTTNDNRDVHAYGYLAPPDDPAAPALVVGVWMGNSNNEPNKGSLSLDSSAPLWSAITTAVSQGSPIASFRAPDGLSIETVDAFTGLAPGPYTTKTVKELFLPGTEPTERETIRVGLEIDAASGLRWQEGCVGPKISRGYMDLSRVESNFETWQNVQSRLGLTSGPRVWRVRRPGRHADVVLLQLLLRPVRQDVGRTLCPDRDLSPRAATLRRRVRRPGPVGRHPSGGGEPVPDGRW